MIYLLADTDPAIATAAIAAGAAILGTVVGGLITLAVARAQFEHESSMAATEAARAQADSRAVFQADTLAELQVALQRYARATGAILHQDELAHAAGAPWGRQQIQGGWSSDSLVVGTAILLLISRAENEHIRDLSKQARDALNRVTFTTSSREAKSEMMEATSLVETSLAAIGDELRRLPPPSGTYRPFITSHTSPVDANL